MTLKTQDPGDEREQSPADPAGLIYCVENRAAYVLARNIHLIDGWLSAVRRLAENDYVPFQWSFPNTLFGPFSDASPTYLFADVEDAMRDLAIAGRVDAAVSVELHRSLDGAAESCARVAELVTDDQREEIRDNYWAFGRDIYNATRLLPRILSGDQDSVSAWFSLGDRLGGLLGDNGLPGFPARFLQTIDDVLKDASRVSTADVGRPGKFPILHQEVHKITYAQFKAVGEVIDNELMRSLKVALPNETWFVLDDKRRVLTFLGVDVPYEQFATRLDFVRVLVQYPGTALSSSKIAELANSGADASQVTAYLSRFRKHLRGTKGNWPEQFQNDPLANEAFIVHHPRPRKLKKGKDTWYKLDLPASRVLFIPIADLK